jgi:integrase
VAGNTIFTGVVEGQRALGHIWRKAPSLVIRWHDLRHTCATLLLGRGVHPKLVQQRLGHASITMTLDRYSHWIPSMGRHAADGMDEALG